MGFLDDRRAKKEQRRLDQARAQADAAYHQQLAEWERASTLMAIMVGDLDRTYEPTSGLILKKGEEFVHGFQGSLLESRRQRGTYQGGYNGVSFKIAKGVRYHVGGSRGTYTPGPEEVTVIDSGDIDITTARVVFRGYKQTREWAFAKLVGSEHDAWKNPASRAVEGVTFLQVSNRQKTSGFSYPEADAPRVRFRLELALAKANGTVEELRDALNDAIAEHQGARPHPPAIAASRGPAS